MRDILQEESFKTNQFTEKSSKYDENKPLETNGPPDKIRQNSRQDIRIPFDRF